MRRAILIILPLLCACEGDAEKAVRRAMLDPDAAQFRDVERCNGDRAVWRGEANGKNSMGAYTGFKPFFYADGSVAYAGDAGFMPMMDRCYSDLPATAESASAAPDAVATQAAAIQTKSSPVLAKASGGEPMHGDYDDEPAAKDRCWSDYCACDTSDPDYGYLDTSICRNLRMGVHVSDDEFSIGARSRDARKALREFNEQDRGYSRPAPVRPVPAPASDAPAPKSAAVLPNASRLTPEPAPSGNDHGGDH